MAPIIRSAVVADISTPIPIQVVGWLSLRSGEVATDVGDLKGAVAGSYALNASNLLAVKDQDVRAGRQRVLDSQTV